MSKPSVWVTFSKSDDFLDSADYSTEKEIRWGPASGHSTLGARECPAKAGRLNDGEIEGEGIADHETGISRWVAGGGRGVQYRMLPDVARIRLQPLRPRHVV
jgi:hypothetical protein